MEQMRLEKLLKMFVVGGAGQRQAGTKFHSRFVDRRLPMVRTSS